MRAAVLTPAARRDLNDIWAYVADRDTAAANRLVTRLERALGTLAERPTLGHQRPDLPNSRYLAWVVRPYVIVYRHSDVELRVIRVLHGRRDFGRVFGRS